MLSVILSVSLLYQHCYSVQFTAFPEQRQNCPVTADNAKVWKAYTKGLLVATMKHAIVQTTDLCTAFGLLETDVSVKKNSCELENDVQDFSTPSHKVLTAPCGRISFSGWQGEYLWAVVSPSTMTVNLTMIDLYLDCSWNCYFQSLTVYNVKSGPAS